MFGDNTHGGNPYGVESYNVDRAQYNRIGGYDNYQHRQEYSKQGHGHQGHDNNRGFPGGQQQATDGKRGDIPWKDMLRDAPRLDFAEIKNELEGPKPLRALASLGGLAMLITSALRLLNVGTLFLEPCRYMVDIYMALFGICVIVIEIKQVAHRDQGFNKNFIYKWMPFTAVIGGKGLLYIFFGTLGFAGGVGSMTSIPGIIIAALGVVYCLIHFTKCQALEEKYDKSLYYSYRNF